MPTGPLEVIGRVSFSPKVPLPDAQLLPPPDDGHFETETRQTRWPVAEIVQLPFSGPAAAGYAAYRARRIATMLLGIDDLLLHGYAAQFECLAEDLEHAFVLPPPGLAS